MCFITRSKLHRPRSRVGEHYKCLSYKYKFSHLDIDFDIGNIVDTFMGVVTDDIIIHIVKELIELRDYVSECIIVSANMIIFLPGERCTK